jgi:hypothetical protein
VEWTRHLLRWESGHVRFGLGLGYILQWTILARPAAMYLLLALIQSDV